MSNKPLNTESPASTLKNDASRQRWELFHRAIAQAKQANVAAMEDVEENHSPAKRRAPVLSIAR